MILTNISTPLLGLVDTAVLGHLDSSQYLAAVALGGLIFSFIFWGFGFLRMGTTGLTAQAVGQGDKQESQLVLFRAGFLAVVISCLVLLLSPLIAQASFYLLESTVLVEQSALVYFDIRIWSTPATLSQYVMLGWFLGQQNVKIPLLVVLITNLSNISLDLLFVYQFGMKIDGVALASVISEYLGLIVSLLCTIRILFKAKQRCGFRLIFNFKKLKSMLLINSHIFIRTWCLIFAFAFFTAQGAKFGSVILAANAVLLNFQTFMAYALDGFAHAAEALVGKAVGRKNELMVKQAMRTAMFWSFIIAMLFALLYMFLGTLIIDQLTSLDDVRRVAYNYLPYLIAMPLVSFVCYVFDGVFIGVMMAREMRNTMLFSLLLVFIPVWYVTQPLGNHGLWMAMLAFMLARGLSMSVVFYNRNLACKH